MKSNNSKRKNNKEKTLKVIRCKALNRPVFEHEVCSQFSLKLNSNNQNNCKNCRHAFWYIFCKNIKIGEIKWKELLIGTAIEKDKVL